MDYIICIYQYTDNSRDHAHCVAEIPMSYPPKNLQYFAKRHGGDYAEVQLKTDIEEGCFD